VKQRFIKTEHCSILSQVVEPVNSDHKNHSRKFAFKISTYFLHNFFNLGGYTKRRKDKTIIQLEVTKMAKKLIIGGLIVVLIGALAVGIYSYTQDNQGLRAGQAQAYGEGGGQGYRGGLADDGDAPVEGVGNRGRQGNLDNGDGTPVEGTGGQGYRGGQDSKSFSPGSEYRGQVGDARQGGNTDGLYEPDPQAYVEEWLTLTGHVVGVDTTGLTLQTDDGQTMSAALGPEWFWSNQDVTVAPGERVTVQAFEEDGEIKVGQISLESNGTVLQLRDDDGRPMWAGRGRGGGRQ
jgi:hypothetical protein